MPEQMSRLTLPVIMRVFNLKRHTVERLVSQYVERIGPPERAGIIRTWPVDVLVQLRAILAEEERLREMRHMRQD